MRILQVIRTLNPAWGGPVEVVRNLATGASARHIDSEVVSVDDPSADWFKSWSVPVTATGGAHFSFGFSRKLDYWLDANVSRFDTVIVHSIWMYFSLATHRAAMRHCVPYYVYAHGALDPWFRYRYPRKHLKKTIYWRLAEHKVLRDAAAVLFTTEEEKRLAEGSFKPYVCRAQVVGCGTEVPAEASVMQDHELALAEMTALYPQLQGRSYLIYLGRIHEKKGVDLLLQGFAAARHFHPGLALVIAGPGDKRLLDQLHALSERLNLQDCIIWTGPLYGRTKWLALRSANAFALISHQENFGISVAEALGCRTPVLISNKVNIWPEIERSGAGLVESDDVAGAARLLERWGSLSGLQREAMKRQARFCFDKHFHLDKSSDRIFKLLSNDLESNVRPVAYTEQ